MSGDHDLDKEIMDRLMKELRSGSMDGKTKRRSTRRATAQHPRMNDSKQRGLSPGLDPVSLQAQQMLLSIQNDVDDVGSNTYDDDDFEDVDSPSDKHKPSSIGSLTYSTKRNKARRNRRRTDRSIQMRSRKKL